MSTHELTGITVAIGVIGFTTFFWGILVAITIDKLEKRIESLELERRPSPAKEQTP